MKFVNNDKGMTLAEVLIAAGITTVMSLAMSTMMVNTVRVQKKTDDKNTSINFQQSLNSRIIQSNQCEEVLNLASPPSYDPPTGVTAASPASEKQDLLNYKVDLSKLIVDGSDVNVGAFVALHCLDRVPNVNALPFLTRVYPSKLFSKRLEK